MKNMTKKLRIEVLIIAINSGRKYSAFEVAKMFDCTELTAANYLAEAAKYLEIKK